jgi:hypothetical protein
MGFWRYVHVHEAYMYKYMYSHGQEIREKFNFPIGANVISFWRTHRVGTVYREIVDRLRRV